LRSIPAGSSVQLCSDSELLISGMLFHIRLLRHCSTSTYGKSC
jgi:hypothetical protein